MPPMLARGNRDLRERLAVLTPMAMPCAIATTRVLMRPARQEWQVVQIAMAMECATRSICAWMGKVRAKMPAVH